MSLPPTSPAQPAARVSAATLELRASTYYERRLVLPSLLDALSACGCWLFERKSVTPIQTDFCLEVQLRSVVDFYAALIASGLELSPTSHEELTGFCLLRKHQLAPVPVGRVISMRLQISFLDELETPACTAPAAAAA